MIGMKWLHMFSKKNSGEIARDRLKILLISDRLNCSPDTMNKIKADIRNVISKYVETDMTNMEIQISVKKIPFQRLQF